MLGAIIGDIVGSPYEFANTSNSRFPLFSKGCDFTDDTICTVACGSRLTSSLGMELKNLILSGIVE